MQVLFTILFHCRCCLFLILILIPIGCWLCVLQQYVGILFANVALEYSRCILFEMMGKQVSKHIHTNGDVRSHSRMDEKLHHKTQQNSRKFHVQRIQRAVFCSGQSEYLEQPNSSKIKPHFDFLIIKPSGSRSLWSGWITSIDVFSSANPKKTNTHTKTHILPARSFRIKTPQSFQTCGSSGSCSQT